jgi:hypothetical protein
LTLSAPRRIKTADIGTRSSRKQVCSLITRRVQALQL